MVPLSPIELLIERYGVGRFGIVDLLAAGASMVYIDQEGHLTGVRAFSRPVVLQACNASCLYSAIEKVVPHFGVRGVTELCRDLKFVFCLEVPDAASSNIRKQEKVKAELPANAGFIASKCTGHQARRTIQGKEKHVVGDVYAVCITCANIRHQNRIQSALWQLLENTQIIPGDPPPAYREHNKSVLLHTLFRRGAFVKGEADVEKFGQDAEIALEGSPEALKVLDAFNGDWTKQQVQIYLAGRALSAAEVRLLQFSACIQLDLLLGADTALPSIDDWFSVADAAGRVSAGILLHGLLPRAMHLGLPRWEGGGVDCFVASPPRG